MTEPSTPLDLDAIRQRSQQYHGLADRLDAQGCLPGLSSGATATAIGLSASLTAADVPDLLAEVERLRAVLVRVRARCLRWVDLRTQKIGAGEYGIAGAMVLAELLGVDFKADTDGCSRHCLTGHTFDQRCKLRAALVRDGQPQPRTWAMPGEQPAPIPNDRPSIQSMVRADLEAREQIGTARYGTPLQAHNGRDALRDAYEEAMDLTIYLRQVIEERGAPAGES